MYLVELAWSVRLPHVHGKDLAHAWCVEQGGTLASQLRPSDSVDPISYLADSFWTVSVLFPLSRLPNLRSTHLMGTRFLSSAVMTVLATPLLAVAGATLLT